MTVTFLTNLVHHHQLPLADELYKLLGDDYHYVATEPLPDWLIKGGYDPNLVRPYVIRSYANDESMREARRLADESDVVIIGSAPNSWVYKRKCENKITFHYNERWLRFHSWKAYLPHALWRTYRHHYQFRNKRLYMLCASAFTAQDVAKFGCYKGKCFKWGYFTKVDSDFEVEALELGTSTSEITPLMWCARFLKWKHPELPVRLAARLKEKGYRFAIDMFGGGEELQNIETMISDLGVSDCVKLKGNMPNDDILKEMRKHKIFLFTSDYNEGWGAVLNESMASGCVPVGSNEIGSVPYLIKDGINGCIFESRNIDSLEEKVSWLLDNPEKTEELRQKALITMKEIWSPKAAANNFLQLVESIMSGELDKYSLYEGPASWAWFC